MSALWLILGCICGGGVCLFGCRCLITQMIEGKTLTTSEGKTYRMVEVKNEHDV